MTGAGIAGLMRGIANDATVKGGNVLPNHSEKAYSCAGDRDKNNLPVISLVDSYGAFRVQDDVIPDKDHFGASFQPANMSAAGIPQIAVVMGSCTVGGACPRHVGRECHREEERHNLSRRPPLVKAATG